jgi:hypothetical protein
MKLAACLFLALLPAWGMCSTDAECRAGARQAFLEVARIARLSDAAQREQVPRLYREIYPALQEYMAHLIPYRVPPGAGLSAEELADLVELAGGWGAVAEEARRRSREILGRHPEATGALVRADFQASTADSLRRALLVVSSLRMKEFFDETLGAFQSAPPALVDPAAYALRDLDDPRAIEPLLRKYPAHPTVYFEILRHLQRNRPPHPLLVKLREDRDPEIRWQASYALAEATYQQAAP